MYRATAYRWAVAPPFAQRRSPTPRRRASPRGSRRAPSRPRPRWIGPRERFARPVSKADDGRAGWRVLRCAGEGGRPYRRGRRGIAMVIEYRPAPFGESQT